MHDMGVGEFVDRDRVAVAAAFRQTATALAAAPRTASAMCWAASIDPAPPGRIEWVLLQTSKFQSAIVPLASSDAFSFVTIAGPYGSQLCS